MRVWSQTPELIGKGRRPVRALIRAARNLSPSRVCHRVLINADHDYCIDTGRFSIKLPLSFAKDLAVPRVPGHAHAFRDRANVSC